MALGMAARGKKVAVLTIDPPGGWPTRLACRSSETRSGRSKPPSRASCGP
ncbi:MAG TPA: hypothetical protein VHG69_04470 [Thermoleophilaceae bacterium]|nr:hypothetical protein [Thermoleophilaceae bacterium]